MADLSRTLRFGDMTSAAAATAPYSPCFRISELDGKTALQIAAMSKRRDLVALLLEHVRLALEDRAEFIVHCRCGSRLPWKLCHSTGVGQPPHYIMRGRIHYRVSPRARCPCGRRGQTVLQVLPEGQRRANVVLGRRPRLPLRLVS